MRWRRHGGGLLKKPDLGNSKNFELTYFFIQGVVGVFLFVGEA
jgi:hypothetical protein